MAHFIDPARLPVDRRASGWSVATRPERTCGFNATRIGHRHARDIDPGARAHRARGMSRLRVQEWAGPGRTQSAWSVRKIVGTLSGALQLAVEDGRIASNPAARLKLPKVVKTSKRYLAARGAARTRQAIERRQAGHGRWSASSATADCGGASWLGCTVADLDFRKSRLLVRHTVVRGERATSRRAPKSYEERSVPCPAIADGAARSMVDGGAGRSPGVPGRAKSGLAASQPVVPSVLARRGCGGGRTRRDSRRTSCGTPRASLAIAAGANVKARAADARPRVREETLDTYTDLFEDDLDGVAAALDEVLAPDDLWAKSWADRRNGCRHARPK